VNARIEIARRQHPCVRAARLERMGLNHRPRPYQDRAGQVEGFLKDGYNVVATSLLVSQSLTASARLILVDGDIRNPETATKSVDAAIRHFGTHRRCSE